MNRVVKSFGPNALVLDKDGNEVELFEGIVLYDTDQIIGDVEFEMVADEDLPQPEELTPEQLAILEGADPTQVFEAAAAGPQAGEQPAEGGGHRFIALDRLGKEILPEAGYPTGTFVYNYEDPLDDGEQLLIASFYESEIEPPITPEEVISFDPPLIPVDQEPEPSPDQVQEPSPVEPEEEPPSDEGEDEVPEQPEVLPEDPVDDEPDTDPEDREEEPSDSEDEEDETDPETDGPESEDDESEEDESEGEGDQTDEDQEDDNETEDSNDYEDDVDDVEDDTESDEGADDDPSDTDQTDPGDSDEEEPSEPATSTGQNPGNDKDVGNSPFDGTKGASNDDEGDEGPHDTLEISDVLDTEQTEEEIIPGQNAPRGPQGNNGWGNGDDDAPGGSLEHNNAENNLDGLLSPTEQYYDV